VLKTVVDAFLSVSPENPDAENCVALVNRLMATYTNYRARLVLDDGYHVWDVYLTDTAPDGSAPAPHQETAV
jgi:hypothetical protein